MIGDLITNAPDVEANTVSGVAVLMLISVNVEGCLND